MPSKLPTRSVPCDGCRICCQGDAIRLEDEDLTRGYATEPHPYIPGALMLAHRPNGDCVYLNERGCAIHGRAPALCRVADCRGVALRYDLASAQALHMMGRLNFDVWDRGNRLLDDVRRRQGTEAGARRRRPKRGGM